MPAAAQIDELSLPIERERRLVGQPCLDMLDLERLRQVAADLDRLGPRHLDPLELFVFFDDFGHFGLDLGEVLFAQFVRQIEVVIKAVVDRGAKGQLHAVVQPHHGPGHDVRRNGA